jgi:hypothetical protein
VGGGSSHLFGITDLLVSRPCGTGEVAVGQDGEAETGVVDVPSATRQEPPNHAWRGKGRRSPGRRLTVPLSA